MPPIPRNGFSLIEVVLAIGILSFVCVPLMGLIPVGLDLFRSSNDESALTLIRTQLVSEFRSIGYSKLYGDPEASFSREYSKAGEPIIASEGIYKAVLTTTNKQPLDAPGQIRAFVRLNFQLQKNGVVFTNLAISIPDDGI